MAADMTAISGLKPAALWHYFAEISAIPRGSKDEAAIVAYVVDLARKLNLSFKQDNVSNVVVKKHASPGLENRPAVCLQGHLDMVCEKNKETQHDFTKDPIQLVRDGNFLRAKGTTLGADNGIGVATALAIMADSSLVHGPLEFLFTIDEETGLTGANSLTPGFVESKILINLDAEEEGDIYVGCAGGMDSIGKLPIEWQPIPADHQALTLNVKGLKGGHSGLEIHLGRGNAIKLVNRGLSALQACHIKLAHIEGGNKHNAIPREAEAVVLVPSQQVEQAQALIAKCEQKLRQEVKDTDPDFAMSLEPAKTTFQQVMSARDSGKLIKILTDMPHGVEKMCADIPSLVETSTNLAIIETKANEVMIHTSQRSSVESEKKAIAQRVHSVFELAGAKASSSDGYPGWAPNLNSAILKVVVEAFGHYFKREPHVTAIHAGLECGILLEKFPGMDAVSFGPTILGAHSPDERVQIDTVERFWQLLLNVLQSVK